MIDIGKLISKTQEAYDKRNYDYAIDLAKQIIELSPGEADARKIMRSSLVMKCELQKVQPQPIMAYIIGIVPVIRIVIFSLLKKHDQILLAGEDFLAKNPFSIWGRMKVASSLKMLDYVDSALEEYEALLTYSPNDIKVLKALGELSRLKNDVKRSHGYYQKALALRPSDLETTRALKDLSALTILDGGWNKALSSKDVVKNAVVSQDLERESQMVKDSEIDQEIKRVNEIINKNPDDPENVRFHKKIGELQIRQKYFKPALESYEKALRLAPADGSLSIKIGDISLLIFDEKIKEAQSKLSAEPANPSLKESLTKLQQDKKTYQMEEYRRRVRLHPTNLSYKYQLGCAYLDSKMIDDAIAEFQNSVRDHKMKLSSLYNLGLCFKDKKLFDIAITQFQKALESPSLTHEASKLVRYNLGLAYEANKNYEQAMVEYKKIMEIDINYKNVKGRIAEIQSMTK